MSEAWQWFSQKKVIVCVGTGGVGKTTTSAALGVKAAQEGKKVLVITVDPAKRLATTLGIDTDSSGPKVVQGQNYSGHLEAALIQPQQVFDDFITHSARDAQEAQRMMKNRLYRQLTTRLSGSQEFTSLEVLVQMVESKDYDLVILDTPPAHHAMDFLRAPMKLHSLFQSSVTKWFVQSGGGKGLLQRVLSTGADKAFSALHQLTGAEFISELREFFELAQSWQEVLARRMIQVHEILTGSESAFLLVTSFDEAKLEESYQFQQRLKREGYLLAAMLVNRAFPLWLSEEFSQGTEISDEERRLLQLREKMVAHTKERAEKIELYRQKMGYSVDCWRVPEFSSDIYDLKGIEMVASHLPGEESTRGGKQ